MDDLISRQAAIDALEREKSLVERPITETRWFDLGLGRAQDVLSRLPSAQPERKRGEWRHYEGYLTCSECGTEYDDDIMTHCCDDVPKYCPNCGADMRGEEEE